MKARTRTQGGKDEDAGTGHGRSAATSTTPIRHSRVIKRPRDLFPSESRRERRIHPVPLSPYIITIRANRPRVRKGTDHHHLRLIIAVPFRRGRSLDRIVEPAFSANPTRANHPLHPLPRARHRSDESKWNKSPDERVFHPRCRVERGFVTPVTQASLRGVHVGVTKTNRSRI